VHGKRSLASAENRAPDPPSPGSTVATLTPLPGSVLGAATIVAAQGALAASGTFLAVWATHAMRVQFLGRGIGAWRFGAAVMLAAFAVMALAGALGLVERRAWARPVTFAVEAAVICGYLLTFVFDPIRALVGMAVAVGVLALVLGPRADEAFAPVETD
jgi:anti-sigma-K factor RskA